MLLFPDKKKDRIIEFQTCLLKELTLTASSLQNRHNPVRNITAAAREVLDLCFVFTFQPGDDDRYELHLFWCGAPAVPAREAGVNLVSRMLAGEDAFKQIKDFAVANTTAVAASPPGHDIGKDIALLCKSFPGENLQSSCMVGIALGKDTHHRHEAKTIAENVLIALAASAGSIRALTRYTREIERFATRDPLTNLYNQIAFWDLLNYETERSKRQQYRFSILVLDLDNFKTMNDLYGHDVGDNFLRAFSVLLKGAVRAGDIASRYAGDQFIAILPVCDEGQAYIVARRILENLREFSHDVPGGAVFRQTVSIGVAVFPDHAQDARDLYLLGESMLLQAKTFGKDRISMPSEHDDVKTLKSMGDKNIMILEALSQRRIVPYFQPIMNVKDMKIEAYEVLTRIVLNDRVIPAAEFIETAESMGAIGKLDYQLIEQAFSKARESRYAGSLFLNLSPKALVLNEFMPTVRKLLRDYGMEPSQMVFEITERDTVKQLDMIGKHIRDLKGEGFRFAIDDFGAGYSSFQYIRSFSVDFLKVDGDFIRNMNGTSTVEKAIVSSIAALSEKLGIKTIAEFVETEDILGLVESAGIDYAQGYYIKRPSPDLA